MATRRLDTKLRLSIPQEAVEALRLGAGTELDVNIDDGALIAVPMQPRCSVCGSQGPLLAEFGDDPVRHICIGCSDAVCTRTLTFK